MQLTDRLAEYRQTLTGDFTSPVAAQKFVAMMQRDHPAELAEWMTTHAIQFVTAALTTQETRSRAIAFRRAGAAAFHEAFEQGELRVFAMPFVIDDGYTRRPLGQMTGRDCQYVADNYDARANVELARAAFMRALAVRAGERTVAEVMPEAEVERLMRSFTREGEFPALTA